MERTKRIESQKSHKSGLKWFLFGNKENARNVQCFDSGSLQLWCQGFWIRNFSATFDFFGDF
jgi:hypothetical protein